MAVGKTMEFVTEQYRHGKTILALGASSALLERAGIESTLPDGGTDPGLFVGDVDANVDAFIAALGQHRHPARETDPPRV